MNTNWNGLGYFAGADFLKTLNCEVSNQKWWSIFTRIYFYFSNMFQVIKADNNPLTPLEESIILSFNVIFQQLALNGAGIIYKVDDQKAIPLQYPSIGTAKNDINIKGASDTIYTTNSYGRLVSSQGRTFATPQDTININEGVDAFTIQNNSFAIPAIYPAILWINDFMKILDYMMQNLTQSQTQLYAVINDKSPDAVKEFLKELTRPTQNFDKGGLKVFQMNTDKFVEKWENKIPYQGLDYTKHFKELWGIFCNLHGIRFNLNEKAERVQSAEVETNEQTFSSLEREMFYYRNDILQKINQEWGCNLKLIKTLDEIKLKDMFVNKAFSDKEVGIENFQEITEEVI